MIPLEYYRIITNIDPDSANHLNLSVNWVVREWDKMTVEGRKVSYNYGIMIINGLEITNISSTKFSNILSLIMVPKK